MPADLNSVFGKAPVVEQKTPFDIDKLTDRFRRKSTDWSIPEAFLCILYFLVNCVE